MKPNCYTYEIKIKDEINRNIRLKQELYMPNTHAKGERAKSVILKGFDSVKLVICPQIPCS